MRVIFILLLLAGVTVSAYAGTCYTICTPVAGGGQYCTTQCSP